MFKKIIEVLLVTFFLWGMSAEIFLVRAKIITLVFPSEISITRWEEVSSQSESE